MANTQTRVFVLSRFLSKSQIVICSLLLLFAASVNAQDTVFRYSADSPSESNASGTDIYQVLTTTGAALGDVLKLSGTASQNTGLDIRGAYLDFTIQSDTPGVVRTIKKTNNAGRFYNFNEASGTNAAMTLKDLSIQGSDSEIGNVIGIFLHNSTPNSRYDVTIDNVSFSGFKNSGYKGAVFDFTRGDLYMTVSNGLTFDSNKTTAAYGGAFDMENSGKLAITGDSVIFNNNSAKSYGGAIHGSNTTITANVVKFTNNTANEEFGGAVNLYNGTLTITGQGENPTIEISGNSAAKLGGAIRGNSAFSNGAFTFANNTAGTNGGAIYCDSITFSGDDTSATFTGNTASGSGNDLYVNGSSGTVLSFTDGGTYSFDGGIYVNNANAQTTINEAQVTIAGRANDSTNVYQLQNVTVSNGGKLTANLDNIDTLTGTVNLGAAGATGSLELNAGQGVSKTLDNTFTIAGAGSLIKTGAGTATLSGASSSYTGGTTILAGTLAVSTVGALGTSAVTINGGTLDASPAGKTKTFANAIVIGENGGTVSTATGDYSSFASLSGSGDLTTTGFVQFNGTGGYDGHITVSSGYVCVSPGAVGTIDLTLNSSNFKLLSAGTLSIGKLNSTTEADLFTSDSSAMTFEIGAGTTASDSSSYAGRIRGISGKKNLTVKKVGAGTQTLNRTGYAYGGENNSIKEVIVDGGKLVIDASHSVFAYNSTTGFWGTAPVTVNSGATLEYVKAWTISPNVNMTVNSGTLTIDNSQYINQLVLNSGTVNGNGNVQVGLTGTGAWSVKGGTSTINNSVILIKNGDYSTLTINFDKNATLDVKKTITGYVNYPGMNLTLKGTGDGPGNINIEATSGTMDYLGTVTFDNMNGSIAGVISRTASVVKTGAGTVTLSAANTYSGGTTISGGTLAVSNVNGLGTGAVTVNGGMLDASGAGKTQTFANAIVVGSSGGTVTVASGDYSSFASISGSGNLTTNGYLHLNGTGGYNGHLTVNSGFVRINPGAFGVFDLTLNNSSNFNVLNSGTIQIGKLNSTTDSWLFASSGSNTYIYEIGAGTSSTDTASYSGYIRGSGNNVQNLTIKKVGDGTQTFNHAGYVYGTTTNSIKEVIVDKGKMIIDASNNKDFTAGGTTGFWGTAPITINAGGTLQYQKAWTTSANVSMTINGGTLTLNSSEYLNKITFNSGTVNGSGQLRAGYVGTATWTVTGGTTTINNSVYVAKNGNYKTFTINIADGATLDAKKNIAGLSSHTGTDLVINGSGTAGTGTLKLHAASGATMTDLGTIKFNNINVELSGNAGWLGSGFFNGSAVTLTNSTMKTSTPHTTNGTVITLDNSTLKFDGEINSYIHQITLKNGSTISGTTANSQFRTGHQWNSQFFTVYESGKPENVMNTISADIAMFDTGKTTTFNIAEKAPLTFSGNFLPAASGHYNGFTKTGAGELTLTQPLANVGNVAINQGTLTLSAGGTLNNLSGSGVLNYGESAITLNNATNSTFSGDILGSGSFTKTGTGTLTLSQTPEYTGSTTVEAGTLSLTQGGTLYNLSGGSLDENGEIAVAATLDSTGKALTLDNSETTKFIGSIKADSIVKTGDGTLQIYAAAEGQVSASSFVVSSGRLDMKEYFTGSLEIESGASLSPGNSIGTLTVDGAFSLDSGATLLLEVGKNDQGEIVVDQLILSGDVSESTFAQGSIINIVLDPASGLQGGDSFTDLVFITTTSDADAASIYEAVKNATISYYFPGYEVKLDGSNILLSGTLDANAIPEPSTWALLILGVASLLYWRKRKISN